MVQCSPPNSNPLITNFTYFIVIRREIPANSKRISRNFLECTEMSINVMNVHKSSCWLTIVRWLLLTHSFTLTLAYSVLIHLGMPSMKTFRYQSLTVKRKLEIIDRVENLHVPLGKKMLLLSSRYHQALSVLF